MTKNKSLVLPILPYLKPYKAMLFGVLVSLLITSASVLAISQGIKIFIDHGIAANDSAMLDKALFMLFFVVSLLAIFTFLRFFLITYAGERIIADLRGDIYKQILRLSPSFYEKTRAGDILANMTADTTLLQTVIGSSLSVTLRNGVLLIGAIFMLLITSEKLTLMLFILIPLVVTPIMVLGKRLRVYSKISQDKVAELTAISEETIGAIKTIQAYVREEYENSTFSTKLSEQIQFAFKRIALRGFLTAVIISMVFGGIGVVLWIGGHQVLDGNMTSGELTAFVYIAVVCAGTVAALSDVYGDLQKAAGAIERVMGFLNTKPEITEPINGVSLSKTSRGDIEFKNVTFHYESNTHKPALDDVSFTIKQGKINALVGKSGAGKSTLFMLLERFYDVQKGVISVCGIDIKKIKLKDLRKQFTYVSQDSLIFSSSALENIRYGCPSASLEKIKAAAKAANALEFIEKLPNGFDTYLGEKGVRISGGQKQRIAIARAILNDPKILLLDEATSSLDSENEQSVQEALSNLMKGRTTIVIAHRLSTVKDADQIIVLDKGKVVETGTHKSLIAKKSGVYSRLAKLQLRG